MRNKWTLGAVLISGIAATSIMGVAIGDDDHDRNSGAKSSWYWMSRGVLPVTNSEYASECASCHTGYSPGLLPARSWQRLMGGLSDHFGDNAELAPDVHARISDYLVIHAADQAKYRLSAKIERSIDSAETPLRITETRYFQRKHDEVPQRMVRDNPQVGSFANCAACHTGAEQGQFDDDNVRIPGYGRFD